MVPSFWNLCTLGGCTGLLTQPCGMRSSIPSLIFKRQTVPRSGGRKGRSSRTRRVNNLAWSTCGCNTTNGEKLHYAFIAGVNLHEHGITVVIIISAFLEREQIKRVGLEEKGYGQGRNEGRNREEWAKGWRRGRKWRKRSKSSIQYQSLTKFTWNLLPIPRRLGVVPTSNLQEIRRSIPFEVLPPIVDG